MAHAAQHPPSPRRARACVRRGQTRQARRSWSPHARPGRGRPVGSMTLSASTIGRLWPLFDQVPTCASIRACRHHGRQTCRRRFWLTAALRCRPCLARLGRVAIGWSVSHRPSCPLALGDWQFHWAVGLVASKTCRIIAGCALRLPSCGRVDTTGVRHEPPPTAHPFGCLRQQPRNRSPLCARGCKPFHPRRGVWRAFLGWLCAVDQARDKPARP